MWYASGWCVRVDEHVRVDENVRDHTDSMRAYEVRARLDAHLIQHIWCFDTGLARPIKEYHFDRV